MITMEITPDGGEPYRVVAKSRHIVQWERLGKGRSLARFNEGSIRLTDLCEVAHIVAVREQRFAGTFTEFLDSHDVKGIDPDEEAKAAAAKQAGDGGASDGDPEGDPYGYDESGPTHPAP